MNQKKVYIIGAGVSGLVAAIELEKAGYEPIMIERTTSIGGRVKTDLVNNIPFDHGFQVLLTDYPAVNHYLDKRALELQKFRPGTIIFSNKKKYKIGDPIRDFSFLISSLFSSIGTFRDKMKILKLQQMLRRMTVESVFKGETMTTRSFLHQFGFSEQFIENFFRPFFSGIFLEPDLRTPHHMFLFVYKMFGQGFASIPKGGIGAVPEHLDRQLNRTKKIFNVQVDNIRNKRIELTDGRTLPYDLVIIATDPSLIIDDYSTKKNVKWHECHNLYFKTSQPYRDKPIIRLIADQNAVVNNFHFVTDFGNGSSSESVLSVTVLNSHQLNEPDLIKAVVEEMRSYLGLEDLEHLRTYRIANALPDLRSMKYKPDAEDVVYSENIILSGDYLANPSLNAAMESGRVAAGVAISKLSA